MTASYAAWLSLKPCLVSNVDRHIRNKSSIVAPYFIINAVAINDENFELIGSFRKFDEAGSGEAEMTLTEVSAVLKRKCIQYPFVKLFCLSNFICYLASGFI